jgi:hypothetical protein
MKSVENPIAELDQSLSVMDKAEQRAGTRNIGL